MSKDAKVLRHRVKDGKPSSAEADQVLTRAARLQTFVQGHQVPTAANAWAGVSSQLENVAAAYQISRNARTP